MRVYLKNGRRVKVTQKQANQLAEMIVNQKPTERGILVSRKVLGNDVHSMFDIDEIVAIG